jgi:hypothetical protein
MIHSFLRQTRINTHFYCLIHVFYFSIFYHVLKIIFKFKLYRPLSDTIWFREDSAQNALHSVDTNYFKLDFINICFREDAVLVEDYSVNCEPISFG